MTSYKTSSSGRRTNMPREHNFYPKLTDKLTDQLEGIDADLANMKERAYHFGETKNLHARFVKSAQKAFENIQSAQLTPNRTMAKQIIENTTVLLNVIRAGLFELERAVGRLENQKPRVRRSSTSSSSSSSSRHEVQDVCSVWDSIIDALAPYFVSSYTPRCS